MIKQSNNLGTDERDNEIKKTLKKRIERLSFFSAVARWQYDASDLLHIE